jgi:F-type H+-transporting ATPase subunit b
VRIRLRHLFAVTLVVFAVAAVAAPAFAQETPATTSVSAEEPSFATPADKECAEKLATGSSVDDCQQAPNPLLPAWNEVIWGMLSFAVLFFLMAKFAMPQVRSMMTAREEKIRDDLEQAENARTSAEEEKARYEASLAEARGEAGKIIEEARQAAEQVRRDLIARAEVEANEIKERAQVDISAQQQRALTELRTDVAALSIDLAERIVERNLDAATQQQLVDSFINQVGSN